MLLRQQERTLVVHTPAKLNLFLEVLGKRTDGYHELEMLMVTVGQYDTLRFTEESSPDLHLACGWAGPPAFSPGLLPTGEDNLVLKAAKLLRDVTRTSRGVRIELTKRIPLAAGLAGGSSDCAATLVALNRIWNLKLSEEQLLELAARLGSDVAFFLARTPTAICRGRGELLEPVAQPMRLHFVIAKPTSGLSTADVFRQGRPVIAPRSVRCLSDALQAGRLSTVVRLSEHLASSRRGIEYGCVSPTERVFRLPFVGHQMSGSGTSYFGICWQRDQAQALAARVRSAGRDYVFVASTQA